ncbi:DUF4430 domain-containing protein [Vagococcus sp. PNs007]|uniref:DUF4430 domain-containing protein n=1 Tax=Vagococcus proximus TaxID=2991417 RepID=A0ABT5WZQ4_9ENTE|nr:DUF4430 domain-containing protein [Vagococcus proximus]MDF0479119.1 DUF4430 domain-containing protein [Vagococcus proximus]
MKTMKKLMAVMVLGLVLTGCSAGGSDKKTENSQAKTEETSNKKAENEQKATIQVIVDDKEEAKKEVTFEEGQSLAEVMDANFDMADDNGMVSSIDGHEQNVDDNKYWLFDINGKPATKGASDTELKTGDEVAWKLNKLEMK